ncbi:hypothetical protein BABINDRAFT_19576, partial [Babjeviella inositovora NRRL Y-12698]
SDAEPTRIIGNIYISSIAPLEQALDLFGLYKITHILSLVPDQLPPYKNKAWWSQYQHKQIDILDDLSSNLLKHATEMNQFIDDALFPPVLDEAGVVIPSTTPSAKEKHRGAILIHCVAGQSRSVSACAMYLMYRYDLPYKTALALITKRHGKSITMPNDSFKEQLASYDTFFHRPKAIDTKSGEYKQWNMTRKLKIMGLGENDLDGAWRPRNALQTIHHDEDSDEEEEAERVVDETTTYLRCTKCRYVVAQSTNFIPHDKPTVDSRHATFRARGGPSHRRFEMAATSCSHFFVDPFQWMKPELDKGDLLGKFFCPNPKIKCGNKVGGYKWDGMRCSCGAWVIPGVHLLSAKTD